MKTHNKPHRLKLYFIEQTEGIFELLSHIGIVIVTIELLAGFATICQSVEINKVMYVVVFSYFIRAIAMYFKLKLNNKR